MPPADDSFAVIPYAGAHSEDDIDLFGEYRNLYPILVEGRRCVVPEDNCVLRALQFVEIYDRTVRMPWRLACRASVAMTSSASTPLISSNGQPIARMHSCRGSI